MESPFWGASEGTANRSLRAGNGNIRFRPFPKRHKEQVGGSIPSRGYFPLVSSFGSWVSAQGKWPARNEVPARAFRLLVSCSRFPVSDSVLRVSGPGFYGTDRSPSTSERSQPSTAIILRFPVQSLQYRTRMPLLLVSSIRDRKAETENRRRIAGVPEDVRNY